MKLSFLKATKSNINGKIVKSSENEMIRSKRTLLNSYNTELLENIYCLLGIFEGVLQIFQTVIDGWKKENQTNRNIGLNFTSFYAKVN